MHPADSLWPYLLQSCLLLVGVGTIVGRVLRWWRRRRDPWRELARRTVVSKP